MKQLVDASIQMLSMGVFHRDIKKENVLIEKGSAGTRVRIIDFGCGCFVRKEPFCIIYGTMSAFSPSFVNFWTDDFHLNLTPFCVHLSGY